MPTVKKSSISLKAVETLADEVISEGAAEYTKILNKLLQAEPGTDRHRSLLCDLSVAAHILTTKAATAGEAIEEYLDSLPDDD